VSFDALSEISKAAKPVKVIRLDKLPSLTSGKPDLIAIANLFRA
jgi:hypothetical protein